MTVPTSSVSHIVTCCYMVFVCHVICKIKGIISCAIIGKSALIKTFN